MIWFEFPSGTVVWFLFVSPSVLSLSLSLFRVAERRGRTSKGLVHLSSPFLPPPVVIFAKLLLLFERSWSWKRTNESFEREKPLHTRAVPPPPPTPPSLLTKRLFFYFILFFHSVCVCVFLLREFVFVECWGRPRLSIFRLYFHCRGKKESKKKLVNF